MTFSRTRTWNPGPEFVRLCLIVLLFCISVFPSQAHPWGGLVVDSSGTLYFTFVCPMEGEDHYACVWRIDEGAPLPSFVSGRSPSDIILHRTASRQLFAGERYGSGTYQSRLMAFVEGKWQELISPVPDGDLFSVDSYAVSDSGTVVYAVDGRVFVRDRLGAVESIFEDHEFNRLGAMAWSASGKLFAISGDDLIALSLENQTVETRASGLRLDSPEHLPFSGANILFDLTVAPDETTFVAYYGNRQLLAISSAGVVSVLVQSESPWSPHGVDVLGDHVYFLESTVGGKPWWKFWGENRIAPRVRRVSLSTGQVETLYTGI